MNTTMGFVSGAAAGLAAGDASYAMVLGIPTLQTGVFGGLIAGVIAAICYNKFYKTELPQFLGFFAGKRLVPIVTAIIAFLVGLAMPIIWQPVQTGLAHLSYLANEVNTNVSTFIFGVIERALIPFGLHHIFYAPFWYQFGEYTNKAGEIVNGDNTNVSTFIFGVIERALIPFGLHHIFYAPFWYQFGEYTNKAGEIVNGDQAIWFAMLRDGVTNFSSATYQGAGKFLTGKFVFMMFGLPAAALAMYQEARPENKKIVGGILFSGALTAFLTGFLTGKFVFMMFGLPAAALAMYQEARPENKKIVGGILFSGALTAFLTGITEPLEFSFLFVAPILYGIHCIFAGLSFMLMNLFNVIIGMTFSGGFIDYIAFGVLPGTTGFETNWYMVIIVGLCLSVIYYFGFRFAIRKFNLMTPGREKVETSEVKNEKEMKKRLKVMNLQ